MNTSNSNSPADEPADETTSFSSSAPRQAIQLTPGIVSVPRGAANGNPASARSSGLAESAARPRTMETPSTTETKAKVPQAPRHAAPKQTIKVTFPVPRLASNGKPTSPGPNGLAASAASPKVKEAPSATQAKAKVPQAATPVAARPGGSQDGARPPSGAPTGATANVTNCVEKSPIPPQPDVDPTPPGKTPLRQYFFPDGLRPEDLAPGIRQAFVDLVEPCMAEMVVAEENPTAKAIAGPIPFEKSCEILLQSKLAALYLSDNPDWEEIERLTGLLDRIARRVHRATDQLIRLQVLDLQRSKHEQSEYGDDH